ncbi:MAG: DUF421 domain-containing protein [Bacteroidetes bacterium QH_10_64_37]|jgi:uncharacterized membrane protein YcaP (DUF421 family)|nr:MAG: DUF421 domain-containing protein [Bacteroidetes bacterium QH_10_64_37]
MINLEWIQSTSVALTMVILTAVGIYLILMLCTRLAGLRSFSKMSTFDFAITVATGSLVASVLLTKDPPLVQGAVGLVTLFGIQFIVSYLRSRSTEIANVVDNEPLLLMVGTEVLHQNLKAARVTVDDLREKLREANVTHLEEVRAVVMESTGYISVLHADPDGSALDLRLFEDVRGAEALNDLPKMQRSEGPTR